MALIEIHQVDKTFRIPSTRRDTIREHFFAFFRPRRFEDLRVLQSISFAVSQGESIGIMGRNGCGKSTLLKILAGIYSPDRGTVAVRAPLTPILELGVGWNNELTARDNLLLTGTAMGLTLRELHQQFDEIIAFAELERFVDLQLKFYSSGMSSRLAYAIAFKAVREILLLDEVFAVGDASFTGKCETRYRELHAAGHTLILVSHSATLISRYCQRALLIDDGKLILDDTALNVAAAYTALMGGGEELE